MRTHEEIDTKYKQLIKGHTIYEYYSPESLVERVLSQLNNLLHDVLKGPTPNFSSMEEWRTYRVKEFRKRFGFKKKSDYPEYDVPLQQITDLSNKYLDWFEKGY